jgi:OPA family sugar phosphate sensor protein UhpC-like MFS transporter
MIGGVRTYDFDIAIMFWIGSSVLSMLLAASLWNTKIRN